MKDLEKRERSSDENTGNFNQDILSKVIRAGKRTYFFDVKATRKDDYYLTITESKKRLGKEGKVFYEKHKIFLYKEDFEKFTEGLREAVTFAGNGEVMHAEHKTVEEHEEATATVAASEFSDVDFDELGAR